MTKEFNYEIKESLAVISNAGNTAKELNLISYNGGAVKYDLRLWRIAPDRKMLKGITLTQEEARALKTALNSIKDL